jgi:hypothetical protein
MLDTPGHHQFVVMRENGGAFADAVLLVVDAVEGCRPQTFESAQIALENDRPIIVAINKCDSQYADVRRSLHSRLPTSVDVPITDLRLSLCSRSGCAVSCARPNCHSFVCDLHHCPLSSPYAAMLICAVSCAVPVCPLVVCSAHRSA